MNGSTATVPDATIDDGTSDAGDFVTDMAKAGFAVADRFTLAAAFG